MEPSRRTWLDERRRASRFDREPRTDFAAIWHPPDAEALAEVHDESLGGLSLVLEDASAFFPGTEVQIAYAGELLTGEVRHVEPREDGTYVVGFACRRLTD